MSDELFPLEEVKKDSPKMAWLKKHPVATFDCPHLDNGEGRWAACWVKNLNGNGLPDNFELCGFGDTEEQAIIDLAVGFGIRLWNEEGDFIV